jgi:hypothetical protein
MVEGQEAPNATTVVLKETELYKEMQSHQRVDDKYWRTVECLQTCIKSRVGHESPIFVNFLAPLDETQPSTEIDYSYEQSFMSDYDLICGGEDQLYCEK